MDFSKLDALASVAELIGGKDDRNVCDTQKRNTRRRMPNNRSNGEAGALSLHERLSVSEYGTDHIESALVPNSYTSRCTKYNEAISLEPRTNAKSPVATVAWKAALQQSQQRRNLPGNTSNCVLQRDNIGGSETREVCLQQYAAVTALHKRSLSCQPAGAMFEADDTCVQPPAAKRRNASSASGLLLNQQQYQYQSLEAGCGRTDMEARGCKPSRTREIREIQQLNKVVQSRPPSGAAPRSATTASWPALVASVGPIQGLRRTGGGPSSGISAESDEPCNSGHYAVSGATIYGKNRTSTGAQGPAPSPSVTHSPERKIKRTAAVAPEVAAAAADPAVAGQGAIVRTSPGGGDVNRSAITDRRWNDTVTLSPCDAVETVAEAAPATAAPCVAPVGTASPNLCGADLTTYISMMAQSPSKGGPDLLGKMRIAETLLMQRDKLTPQLVQLVIKQLAVLCQSASVDDLMARMPPPSGGPAPPPPPGSSQSNSGIGSAHYATNTTTPCRPIGLAQPVVPSAPGACSVPDGTLPVATGTPTEDVDENGGSTSSSSSSSRTATAATETRVVPVPTVAASVPLKPPTHPQAPGVMTAPTPAQGATLNLPPFPAHFSRGHQSTMPSVPSQVTQETTAIGTASCVPFGAGNELRPPTATATNPEIGLVQRPYAAELHRQRTADVPQYARSQQHTQPSRSKSHHHRRNVQQQQQQRQMWMSLESPVMQQQPLHGRISKPCGTSAVVSHSSYSKPQEQQQEQQRQQQKHFQTTTAAVWNGNTNGNSDGINLPAVPSSAVSQPQDPEQLRPGLQQQEQPRAVAQDLTGVPSATVAMLIAALAQQAHSSTGVQSLEDPGNVNMKGAAAAVLLLQQLQQQRHNQGAAASLVRAQSGSVGYGIATTQQPQPPPHEPLRRRHRLASPDARPDATSAGGGTPHVQATFHQGVHEYTPCEPIYAPVNDARASVMQPSHRCNPNHHHQQQQQSVQRTTASLSKPPSAAAGVPRRDAFSPTTSGKAVLETGGGPARPFNTAYSGSGVVGGDEGGFRADAAASPVASMPPQQLSAAAIGMAAPAGMPMLEWGPASSINAAGRLLGPASQVVRTSVGGYEDAHRYSIGIARQPMSPDAYVTIRLPEATRRAGSAFGKVLVQPPPSAYGMG